MHLRLAFYSRSSAAAAAIAAASASSFYSHGGGPRGSSGAYQAAPEGKPGGGQAVYGPDQWSWAAHSRRHR